MNKKKMKFFVLVSTLILGVLLVNTKQSDAWRVRNYRTYNPLLLQTRGYANTYQSRGFATASVKIGYGPWYTGTGYGSASAYSYSSPSVMKTVWFKNSGR